VIGTATTKINGSALPSRKLRATHGLRDECQAESVCSAGAGYRLFAFDRVGAVDPRAQEFFTDMIALIQKSGPQVQTEVIHGVGDYLFIDHLDEVAAKMNAFLAVK
jgi:hypothetical protein